MPSLWRVFPWDPRARAGGPYSPAYLPAQSGQGRFDLPLQGTASSWYFAETPEHAVGEKIQDLRGQSLMDEFLLERGYRLALCSVELSDGVPIADFCISSHLMERDVLPDRLAYRDRDVTRAIVRRLREADPHLAGFRWWSALFGEWHTRVLFSDRLPANVLSFGEPEYLIPESPAVVGACGWLGIETGG
jgi:hypothetical protein